MVIIEHKSDVLDRIPRWIGSQDLEPSRQMLPNMTFVGISYLSRYKGLNVMPE